MFLNAINGPSDLKKLKREDLPVLAEELREKIISTVSKVGGHLASNLGTIELTIALHYFFNSPTDKFVWDVGHQAYCHKILTGRKHRFDTIRQFKGISGFPSPEESEHDSFKAGHASTSISAALGMAVARDIKKESNQVIAIIGDGSLTGGLALEALNNLGYLKKDMLIILNDNDMSISENVGALSNEIKRIKNTNTYKEVKQDYFTLLNHVDESHKSNLFRIRKHLMSLLTPGIIFEKLGVNYIGKVDGHDINALLDSFEKVKQVKGPKILHVLTKKGKGYHHAENDATKFHGVSSFDITNGKGNGVKKITYTNIFSDTIVSLAEKDERIVAITAAMKEGTGLVDFASKFPNRFFDVGIAEGHGVTFAAGLASQGLRPVCAIYSTFLQRAYDGVIHDVCLQNLPVTFAIDRGGLVGADGPTHHGCFDLSFLRTVPNLIVSAPKDENELQHLLYTAIQSNRPFAVRYPRGKILGLELEKPKILEIGKAEILKKATSSNNPVILATGSMVFPSLEAVFELEKQGINVTIVNVRFIKPLDENLILSVAKDSELILTVEENALAGGFGSAVSELLHRNGLKNKMVMLGISDKFIEHGTQEQLRKLCGLTKENIIDTIKENIEKS